MKLYAARKKYAENGIAYHCHRCGKPIRNGEKYGKESVTLAGWVEINGQRLQENYRTTLQVCQNCAGWEGR